MKNAESIEVRLARYRERRQKIDELEKELTALKTLHAFKTRADLGLADQDVVDLEALVRLIREIGTCQG